MIIIVTRDDLPIEHQEMAAQDLRLSHTKLSPDVIDQAELIVFAEGPEVKYLKHRPEIECPDRLDVLVRYIASTPPVTKIRLPWGLPRHRRRYSRNTSNTVVKPVNADCN